MILVVDGSKGARATVDGVTQTAHEKVSSALNLSRSTDHFSDCDSCAGVLPKRALGRLRFHRRLVVAAMQLAYPAGTASTFVTAERLAAVAFVPGKRPSVVTACSRVEESMSDALSVAKDVEESAPANNRISPRVQMLAVSRPCPHRFRAGIHRGCRRIRAGCRCRRAACTGIFGGYRRRRRGCEGIPIGRKGIRDGCPRRAGFGD